MTAAGRVVTRTNGCEKLLIHRPNARPVCRGFPAEAGRCRWALLCRTTSHYPGPLEGLYARHTLIATGRADGDSRLVHLGIIGRLAANRRIAEGEGWTALALERVGGMGRLQLWGVPPTGERREVVPDWAPR
jgi:hypothetical protein